MKNQKRNPIAPMLKKLYPESALVPTPAPAAPAPQTITITKTGAEVRLTVSNLGSHTEIYGILKQAELLVPAIKWEEAK